MRKKYIIYDDLTIDISKELNGVTGDQRVMTQEYKLLNGRKIDGIFTLSNFKFTKEEIRQQMNADIAKKIAQENARSEFIKNATTEAKALLSEQAAEGLSFEERMVFHEKREKLLAAIPEVTVTELHIQRYRNVLDSYVDEIRLQSGCDYFCIGNACFQQLSKMYHLGLRNANYYDASFLSRVGLREDIGMRFVGNLNPTDLNQFNDFFSDQFNDLVPRPNSYIIKSYTGALQWLDYFDKSMQHDILGFDYETNGFPMINGFRITGASMADAYNASFFSFYEIQRSSTAEQWKDFQDKFWEFSKRWQDRIWAYNVQFEQAASYHYSRKFFRYRGAEVINILDGNNARMYSLKYTVQRLLRVNSWDDDFDWLVDMLDELFVHYHKRVNDKNHVTRWTYNPTSEIEIKHENGIIRCYGELGLAYEHDWVNDQYFLEICNKFPEYRDKFIELILQYYGNSFECIPADILGKYCNLDAYYTKLLGNRAIQQYPEAEDVYSGNVKLGARLHTVGSIKNVADYDFYVKKSYDAMAFSYYFLLLYFYKTKLAELSGNINDLEKYPEGIKKLIDKGLYADRYYDVAKNMIREYVDETWEYGIDENRIIVDFGVHIRKILIEALPAAGLEKYSEGCLKTRKVFTRIQWGLESLEEYKLPDNLKEFNHNTIEHKNLSGIVSRLEESGHYFSDIDNMPDKIGFEGKQFTSRQFIEYINIRYNKVTALHDRIREMVHKEYGLFTSYFMYTIFTDWNIPKEDKIVKDRSDDLITDIVRWKQGIKGARADLRQKCLFWIKEAWGHSQAPFKNLDWLKLMCKSYPKNWQEYLTVMKTPEMKMGDYYTFCKVMHCIRILKRYSKVISAYLEGSKIETYQHEIVTYPDENLMSWRGYDPKRYKSVVKFYPRFKICEKLSKRWSAGIHTLSSRSEYKSVLGSADNCLLSYFDINAAEVRSIAFDSKDPRMMQAYLDNMDMYIYAAKLAYPDANYDDPDVYDDLRTTLKVGLLSTLYRVGRYTLAESIGKSPDEAAEFQNTIYRTFPEAKRYSDEMADYAAETGCVKTLLGDVIRLPKDNDDRLKKQGINVRIQGFTAVLLAYAFNNLVEQAEKEGILMQPNIVVHDSSTNSFGIKHILKIAEFYYRNFTKFLYDKFGILYAFKILIGDNYYDMTSFKMIDENSFELGGNNRAIRLILKKMKLNGIDFTAYLAKSIDEDLMPGIVEGTTLNQGRAVYKLDNSKNTAKVVVHNIPA